MPPHPRTIHQQYWRHDALPHLELRSTFNSVQPYKAHSHTAFSIGALVSGRTRLRSEGQDCMLSEGDVVLIEPMRVHACNPVNGQPRSYHMLYVDASWCLDQLSRLSLGPLDRLACPQMVVQQPAAYGLFLSLVDCIHQHDVAGVEHTFARLMDRVFAHWCLGMPARRKEDCRASDIKDRLLRQLEAPPRLRELSKDFGLSQEGVIRLFTRQFGLTPKAFLSNARIEQSKRALRAGTPIVDVSLDLGFSDQSQFHRTFVAYTASTPRQYQRAGSISDNIL